jgi:hypothetical protein
MNTNTRIDGDLLPTSPLVTILQDSGKEVFGEMEHFLKFVKFPKGGEWDENIESLKVDIGVEIGTDDAHGRRLHLHAQFRISHYSYVKLDYRVIQSEMNRVLAEKGYQLKIHYTHGTFHKTDMAAEYTSKSIIPFQLRLKENLDNR